ncbi:MAG: DUF2953 domain-containing protein [Oscillospiraceae bacterium]|jgi:hypothetical protein|nr:DUF2953 domain-containing protein [Oscillospiraceae bacterium]
MLVLVIIISVLLLIALLRIGVIAEYGESGLMLWFKIGFLKFKFSVDDDNNLVKLKQIKKEGIKMRPGSLKDFLDILGHFKNTLGRLRRKLFIKQLILHYTSACENPADTAIRYGAANAVFSSIIPLLENNFKIRHRDFKVFANFDSMKQGIFAKIIISIAVWEAFYVIFALLPIFTSIRNDRKDEK